jgi:forkhead box protein K
MPPASPPDDGGGGGHYNNSFNGRGLHRSTPIAKVQGKEFEYLVRQQRLIIGRNSSTKGEVDVNMGHSSFISRKHVEIFYDDGHFFLTCNGKNGVFVDGAFQRKGAAPLQLAKNCSIRFPSTSIRLYFQSLLDEAEEFTDVTSEDPNSPEKMSPGSGMKPLTINIPHPETLNRLHGASPPSPTGTISVPNSCPTSPNSRGHLYRQHGFAARPFGIHNDHHRTAVAAAAAVASIQQPHPTIAAAAAAAAAAHSQPNAAFSLDMEESKPDVSQLSQNAVVYPSEDGHHLSSAPPGGGHGSQDESKPPFSYAQLIVQVGRFYRRLQLQIFVTCTFFIFSTFYQHI